ncbi:MAG: AbrB/MazE/SpoVT family DNA-binding domain-containing protein [Sulfuricella sp.]|nr:AbrB/MazE/SpoVT family DNA-binding domain-containing protein [Sulfuricella sp.]
MKTAKVFKQGNSQAVRLPKEFRFQEDEVYIRKQGDTVLLIPRKAARWQHLKACVGRFKGEFPALPEESFEERDWPQ